MFSTNPPAIFGQVFSSAWWRIPAEGPDVYITFDDGPHPATTPFILERLSGSGFQATFFCLGKQVEAHPDLYQAILESGHRVGIHSYDHPNGWTTKTKDYLADIEKASAVIESDLFRPPYGKLTWGQWNRLKLQYQIVMWTLSPEDYLSDFPGERILDRLTGNVRPGDIVVLHENDKSKHHIREVLPPYLDWLQAGGFTSKALPHAH